MEQPNKEFIEVGALIGMNYQWMRLVMNGQLVIVITIELKEENNHAFCRTIS